MTKQKNWSHIDNIQKIDPQNPDPNVITAAVALIKKGGVIAFPTRCLYGLGVAALNSDAIEKIYQIKKRSVDKAIPVLIPDRHVLDRLTHQIPAAAAAIMERFWPGKVTLVFKATDLLPSILTAGTGKIGIRLPGHPVAKALTKNYKGPLTATSANLSGQRGYSRISDFDTTVSEHLDLILDAGPLKGGAGSTVVDVTADKPVILREGVISTKEILEAVAGCC